MRRMDGVAHQDDLARTVEVVPAPAADPLEVEPGRATLVARVAHQRIAAEMRGEQSFAKRDGFGLAGGIEPMGAPYRFGAFDDEGGGRFVEAVDMRLEPAVLGLLEDEV